ncbi:hypothetical protein C7N83_08990 [Neisseria iguanae]|uniref:Uncharacterized protein n=1 Tax=Neisseria iguanae TaxID=90242 RepID=A0A2P7TZ60_9NEIS|nr:hypothetical protein C7N83_08990 [Neisseria iguanae]
MSTNFSHAVRNPKSAIPAQAGIRFCRYRNCKKLLKTHVPDSRLRGNDGFRIFLCPLFSKTAIDRRSNKKAV